MDGLRWVPSTNIFTSQFSMTFSSLHVSQLGAIPGSSTTGMERGKLMSVDCCCAVSVRGDGTKDEYVEISTDVSKEYGFAESRFKREIIMHKHTVIT